MIMKHMGMYEGGPKKLVPTLGYLVEQVMGITKVVARELQEPLEQLNQDMVAVVGFSWGFE